VPNLNGKERFRGSDDSRLDWTDASIDWLMMIQPHLITTHVIPIYRSRLCYFWTCTISLPGDAALVCMQVMYSGLLSKDQ
jgi:hypothetical protein